MGYGFCLSEQKFDLSDLECVFSFLYVMCLICRPIEAFLSLECLMGNLYLLLNAKLGKCNLFCHGAHRIGIQ